VKRAAPALAAALSQLEAAQLYRRRLTVAGRAAPGARRLQLADGRELADFSSNDYLGLAQHPALATAMSACAARSGAGSGASHLITGHGREHEQLEEELAAFTRRERALLFSTGYMANLAVLTTLAARDERLLLDRLCHASLIDGARLSGAQLARYPHLDAQAAARLAEDGEERTTVIATDGVFSMDGDIAPLAELARLARAHEAWLVVDDAHGIGVVGESGGGALELTGLSPQDAPVLMGTLGKAFGSFGAFVAGSADLIELLIQKARTYIYTTALPEPVAAATRAALAVAASESWRRERLQALIARFRRQALAAGVPLANVHSSPGIPIQPVLLGSAAAALAAQRELEAAGFLVVAIRPPTVPQGSARLRVSLSAAHTEAEVDALASALGRVCAGAATAAVTAGGQPLRGGVQ
jgi:8-amino-7-oxononanoate synthase